MLTKQIFISTTALLLSASLQAFSLGDAASALSTINSVTNTQQTTTTSSKNETQTQSSDLIGMLTSQLGVSDTQASGGVGSILNYAQKELPSNDYTTLANAIPNASSLLSMAPKTNDTANSALGALSALGGGSSSTMTALASQFSSLGLNSSMISQFVPVILNYLKSSNSTGAMSILSGLFK